MKLTKCSLSSGLKVQIKLLFGEPLWDQRLGTRPKQKLVLIHADVHRLWIQSKIHVEPVVVEHGAAYVNDLFDQPDVGVKGGGVLHGAGVPKLQRLSQGVGVVTLIGALNQWFLFLVWHESSNDFDFNWWIFERERERKDEKIIYSWTLLFLFVT